MIPRTITMAVFLAGSMWPTVAALWSIPFLVFGVWLWCRQVVLALVFLMGALFTTWAVHQALDQRLVEDELELEQTVWVDRCWQSVWAFRCLIKTEQRTRYYLTWQASSPPLPGTKGLATLSLRPWRASVQPGQSSFALWLIRHRVVARGTVQTFTPEPLSVLPQAQYNLRQWLRSRPVNERARGFYEALVIGDRSQLDAVVRAQVARTQTQHLLALSGLHIGSLALWAYWISGWLWQLFPRGVKQDWQKMSALIMAGLLLWVALPAVSLWRAFLMTAVPGVVWLLRHQISLPRLLLWIGCVMVLADPLIWLDLGAWFSWWATLILLMLAHQLRHFKAWQQLVIIQLSLSLLLIPIHALWQLPLFPSGMALNLVLIPWVSFVTLPLAFLTGLGIPGAVELFELAIEVWRVLLRLFDHLVLIMPTLPPLLSIVMGALAGWGLASKWTRWHWLAWSSTTLSIMLLFGQSPRYQNDEFALWVLDAGTGYSVIVETQQGRVLVDLGQGSGHEVQLDQSVMRWHLQAPFGRWHTVILSRNGRSTQGGLETLAQLHAPPEQSFSSRLPEVWPTQWPEPEFCGGNVQWQIGKVNFRFLRPHPRYQPTDPQAAACVLEVSSAAGRVLLLNGITMSTALALAQQQPIAKADVIVSQGRSSLGQQNWVTALAPAYWIIQSATDYQWTYDGALFCTCGHQSLQVKVGQNALTVSNSRLHLLPWLELS